MADDPEQQQRAALVDALGIDPETPHGQALVSLHEGELTVTALAETAESYGMLAAESPAEPGMGEAAMQAIASADRGFQLAAYSTPVEPRTLDDQIRDAESKGARTGDWEDFDRLQVLAAERGYTGR